MKLLVKQEIQAERCIKTIDVNLDTTMEQIIKKYADLTLHVDVETISHRKYPLTSTVYENKFEEHDLVELSCNSDIMIRRPNHQTKKDKNDHRYLSRNALGGLINDLRKFSFIDLFKNRIAFELLDPCIFDDEIKVIDLHFKCAILGPIGTVYENTIFWLHAEDGYSDIFWNKFFFAPRIKFISPIPHHPMIKSNGEILNWKYGNGSYDRNHTSSRIYTVVTALKMIVEMLAIKFKSKQLLEMGKSCVFDSPRYWTPAESKKALDLNLKHQEEESLRKSILTKIIESTCFPQVYSKYLIPMIESYLNISDYFVDIY